MSEYTLSLTILGKDKASGMFHQLNQSLKDMIATAGGVTLARIFDDIGQAAGRMAIEAINAVAYVQNLDIVLTTLAARELYNAGAFDSVGAAMGTAEGNAEGLIQALGEMAILSPYTMEATSNMFRLMMAFGSTTDQSVLLTRGLLEMGSGLGASNEQVQRMAYNLAQIQLEGKVTALDIRQLALAGLPLNDVLIAVGKQFGVNIKNHLDFNKALASGEITWQQFTEGFAKYADDNFGGASERMARTLSGLSSTFKDVFTLTMPQMLGPAVEEITGILSTLLDSFLFIYQDPRLKEIGVELGKKVHEWVAPVRIAVENFTNQITKGVSFEAAFGVLFGNLKGTIKRAILSMLTSFVENLPAATTAVSNFLIGMFSNAATSIPDMATLLMPVFNGILTAITTAAPGLITSFASIWLSFGQTLIDNAPTIITNIATLMGTLLQTFLDNLPQFMTIGTSLIVTIANSLLANLPALLDTTLAILVALVEGFITNLPTLITAAVSIIEGLAQYVKDNIGLIVELALKVLTALSEALIILTPVLVTAALEIMEAFIEYIATHMDAVWTAGGKILEALGKGLIAVIYLLDKVVYDICLLILTGFLDLALKVFQVGKNIILALKQGIEGGDWSGFKTILTDGMTKATPNLDQVGRGMGAVLGDAVNEGIAGKEIKPLKLPGMGGQILNIPQEIGTSAGTQIATDVQSGFDAGMLQMKGPTTNSAITWGTEIGAGLTEGIGEGVKIKFPEFDTTLEEQTSAVGTTAAAAAKVQMLPVGSEMIAGIAEGMMVGWDTLGTDVGTKVTTLGTTTVTNSALPMTAVGTDMMVNVQLGYDAQWIIFQTDVETTFGALYSIIGAAIGLVNNIGAEIIIGITEAMNGNTPALFGAASAAAAGVLAALSAIQNTFGIGLNAALGIASGIEAGTDAAVQAALNLSNKVSSAITVHWGINSPSRVFAKIGESVPEGLALGISRREDLPMSALNRIGQMADAMQNMPTPQKNSYVTVNANVASDFDLDKLTREIVRRVNA